MSTKKATRAAVSARLRTRAAVSCRSARPRNSDAVARVNAPEPVSCQLTGNGLNGMSTKKPSASVAARYRIAFHASGPRNVAAQRGCQHLGAVLALDDDEHHRADDCRERSTEEDLPPADHAGPRPRSKARRCSYRP